MNIDKDRGVTIRKHPTGAQVFMYKDQPGVFLSAFGTPVTATMAREAGFDTSFLLKEREKREKMTEAMQAIEAQYRNGGAVNEVLDERSGFKLICTGMGRHALMAPDGSVMNDRPLTFDEAVAAFDNIAPKEVADDVDEAVDED